MMRFQEEDLERMVRACQLYQQHTAAEWEEYSKIISKINQNKFSKLDTLLAGFPEQHCLRT